ncbi:MAG: hypothetical protein IT444_12845 [Phycisphaeraceae bacterium]|nr:hypothetical protein [Phycisphaeraceae bacterium]
MSEPMVNPSLTYPSPVASGVVKPSVACATFAIPRFRRELAVDRAIRVVIFVAVLLAMLFLPAHFSNIVLIVGAVVWIGLSVISGKVFRQLPQITSWIERDPAAAESAIALALPRHPLQRSVRLLLYHRLAILRHRQQRFAESAAISQALLFERLEPAVNIRTNLLLMLTEANLECGDLGGAYTALAGLSTLPLSHIEDLQRMALQIRYEVACGHDGYALQDLERKIAMIEMLPGPPCGVLHALLAIAAQRQNQKPLADWLWRRAELISTPQALAEVKRRAGR